jgi:hypothetical protein
MGAETVVPLHFFPQVLPLLFGLLVFTGLLVGKELSPILSLVQESVCTVFPQTQAKVNVIMEKLSVSSVSSLLNLNMSCIYDNRWSAQCLFALHLRTSS